MHGKTPGARETTDNNESKPPWAARQTALPVALDGAAPCTGGVHLRGRNLADESLLDPYQAPLLKLGQVGGEIPVGQPLRPCTKSVSIPIFVAEPEPPEDRAGEYTHR
jgi:hypothetical protein